MLVRLKPAAPRSWSVVYEKLAIVFPGHTHLLFAENLYTSSAKGVNKYTRDINRHVRTQFFSIKLKIFS